jgi:NitT/TauT family transport system substrate-binding protein
VVTVKTSALRELGLSLLLLLTAACGGSRPSARGGEDEPISLRLGYFPNLTHATALVGMEKGIFTRAVGPDVEIEFKQFSAGPQTVEAIFADALDAAYIGSNPAINAFVQSEGEAIRIVSGATSGGAFLVVKPEITGPQDLRGRKLASPQRGNTQDVALRAWLDSNGLESDLSGGGDVSVLPQENAQTLETFRSDEIDGAWVPEPWASRMVIEAGAKVLVDERQLWPEGRYVTTHLIVRTGYLEEHPEAVEGLLRGQIETNDFINSNLDEARDLAGGAIAKLTGKQLPKPVIEPAWANLTFTNDPLASTLQKSADEAKALRLLENADLDGIYDLSILNRLLRQAGKPEVKSR